MKIDPRDARFIPEKPDIDFSPQRNKQVIDNSIKKYEAMRASKQKQFIQGLGERSEAVASFLDHVKQGKHNNVDKYFGQRTLAKLRGLEIVDELKSKLNMISTPSPVYVQNGLVRDIKGKIVGKEISNAKKKQKRPQ